jgi:hypothetical protein
MLQKNVVELLKKKDGTQEKRPVDTYEKQINLCAALGDINLSQYGVAESIAATMDRAVQVNQHDQHAKVSAIFECDAM